MAKRRFPDEGAPPMPERVGVYGRGQDGFHLLSCSAIQLGVAELYIHPALNDGHNSSLLVYGSRALSRSCLCCA